MAGEVPKNPKVYHIVHVDRLESILQEKYLLADSAVRSQRLSGTVIGRGTIKDRRLAMPLRTHPYLNVGDCVPFYFCPRSVLLYINWRVGHGHGDGAPFTGGYRGEDEIVHFEADLRTVVRHADANGVHWSFTNVNAAIGIAQHFDSLHQLDQLDWQTIESRYWSGKTDHKMAEFLVAGRFPVHLIERIGVKLEYVQRRASNLLSEHGYEIRVETLPNWYYGD